MTLPSDLPDSEFWAITCYFNPVRYRRWHSNYKIFRKHLKIPLVAVELAYADDFELEEGDADILIRIRGGAALWQKERLLNVALRALPKNCKKVAWVDCDIIFRDDDWVESASRVLDRVQLVQLFKDVHYASPHWDPGNPALELEFSRQSASYVVSAGLMSAPDCFGTQMDARLDTDATGHAWATTRELLDRHGFFDASIMGGGDRAMGSAAHACFERVMERHYMNEYQREHYLAWAERFYQSVKADTAFIGGDIVHLWHGDARLRASRGRQEGLRRFRFDPFSDIAIQDNGAWGWNSDKPELHDYVRAYFSSRREDG